MTSFWALLIFALSASVTPGPNNVMLMTSGVNFGFYRSLPHLSGVVAGFTVMVAIGAFGFSGLFHAVPWMQTAISAAGIVYLLYLAVRIGLAPVSAPTSGEIKSTGKPLTFWEAALFQWVNPKGWVMMVGLVTVYVPINGTTAVLVIIAMSGIISSHLWVLAGTVLSRALAKPGHLRAFNVVMAILLVLSLVPAIRDVSEALTR
jgi:threonine/homoserine/homoserine lactone efflux protein